MDLRKLASLLVRDYSIMAKRHHEMARDCRAISDTWRQVLDATPAPDVKRAVIGADGKVAAPASPQELFLFVDDTHTEVQ